MSISGKLLLTLFGLAVIVGVPAAHAESVVIVVAAADSRRQIDLGELASIYRRKVRIDNEGRLVVPVNLPAAHPIRRIFSQALFGRAPEDLQAYWDEQYFQGISPPLVLDSEEAVLRFVISTPGAIGYVSSCSVDNRVKVLARMSVPGEATAATADCRKKSTGE